MMKKKTAQKGKALSIALVVFTCIVIGTALYLDSSSYILYQQYMAIRILIPLCMFLAFAFLQKKETVFAAKITAGLAVLSLFILVLYVFSCRVRFGGLTSAIVQNAPYFFFSIMVFLYVLLRRPQLGYVFAAVASVFVLLSPFIKGFYFQTIRSEHFQYSLYLDENIMLTSGICLTGFLVSAIHNKEIQANPTAPKQKNMLRCLDSLEKFAALKEQGILTEEEFEAKKQELMSQM